MDIGPAISSAAFGGEAGSCYAHAQNNGSVDDTVRELCVGKTTCEFSIGGTPQGAKPMQNLLRNRSDFFVNQTCEQEFRKLQAIATFSCYEDRIFFGESRWWDVSKQDAAWIITLADLLGSTANDGVCSECSAGLYQSTNSARASCRRSTC